MNIGPTTRQMLSRVLLVNPSASQLEEIARGPRHPMVTPSGRIVELTSTTGAFESLRWMAEWQRLETRHVELRSEAVKLAGAQKGNQAAPYQKLATEAHRAALFCGAQKAMALEAAAALYRLNGMPPTQVPNDATVAVVDHAGQPIVSLDGWEAVASSNRQLYEDELARMPGTRVLDYGAVTGAAVEPNMGEPISVSAWVVTTLVLVTLTSVAIAVLSLSGVFRTMAPNAYAARVAADVIRDTLRELERSCRRLEDPAERISCLRDVADRAETVQAEANQARQEQWAATVGGVTSISRGLLPLAALAAFGLYMAKN